MKILVLSNKDINEVKKTGTNVRAATIYKHFSDKHEVRYVQSIVDGELDWCDCIYVIHFQSVHSYFDRLMETKKPIYYELHSFWGEETNASPKLLKQEFELINKSKATFACSSQLKDHYVKKGINKKKIHITLVGFDLDDYEFIVTYVGNDNEYQGINNIYKVAKELPKITFILIGDIDGPSPPNVERVGYKVGKALQRYMKMSDVLIQPRDKNIICETMSNKFGKYMMYPEKIIATNTSDCKKYILTTDVKNLRATLSVRYMFQMNREIYSEFNNKIIVDKILKVIEN